MKNVRSRLYAVALAASLGLSAVGAVATPAHALSSPAIPVLTFDHTITSHPFSGAPGNAIDIEGLGYVAGDNSMWVADDNGDRVWEINPTTGAYKSQLRGGNPNSNPANADFLTATQVGTGLSCGQALDVAIIGDTAANECLSRTDDFESAIYDSSADVLYVTSGNCCTAGLPANYPFHPTVWKLTRDGSNNFKPSQWQALPEGEDPTAAGVRPGGGIYFGHNTKVKTYDFASNILGTDKTLGVSADIVGLNFTDANTAFVTTATPNTASGRTTATSDSTIHRFDISGPNWTENLAWKFPLASIGVPGGSVDDDGMIDARDLAIVNDTFYVSDGYDGRASGDHPIYVYTLSGAPAPTASFTAVPSIGRAPFTTQFSDTSTPVAPAVGKPTSWAWDFTNDGIVDSTQQFPTHQYATPGNFTVKLTATNAAGFTSATMTIKVKAATNLPGGYTLDGWGGLHRFKVGTGPLPPATSGAGYWANWDIARGAAVLPTGTGGYTLDGWGALHPFRIGGGANPPTFSGTPYWSGWDIARGVALLPNGTGGYEVDGYGGIHPFKLGTNSAPPAVFGNPYWGGQDMARGISITPDGKGGFVSDRTGKLWPFKIGSGGTAPATPNGVAIISATSVQGVSIMFDGTGGYTVDGWGGAHPFGIGTFAPPPSTSGGPYWPGWDIARDIALMPDV